MAINVVSQLADNFAYLVSDDSSKECAVVDCAEADKVLKEVNRLGFKLTAVLTTHFHRDHSGGNEDLARAVPGLEIYGGRAENGRVPAITNPVGEGDTFRIGALEVKVLGIPAHTNGHVAYYLPQLESVFTGDTLFIGGCGRVFEGKPAMMVEALAKLTALPDSTKIYCGHEYTEKNLRFALTLEPSNRALKSKHDWAKKVTSEGRFTVPSTVAQEKETNPFIRTGSPELRASLKKIDPLVGDDPVALFAKARALKDAF